MCDPIISVKNLSYTYHDATIALNNIDLSISKDEIVGLIGPNGAGKTTLILNLIGYLKGDGLINISGITLEHKNLKEVRKKLGIVFQDVDDQLFMPTVYEDIAFGPFNLGLSETEIKKRVEDALRYLDLPSGDFLNKLTHHLSGGEKRKIAIATVLSMLPEILIFDEPTSNLDPKSRRQFINFINTCKQTMLISSQDLELILEVCNRVIVMEKGKIIDVGDPKNILSNSKLMEEHGLEVPISLKLSK